MVNLVSSFATPADRPRVFTAELWASHGVMPEEPLSGDGAELVKQ